MVTVPIRAAVVGVGGFGAIHVNALLRLQEQGLAQMAACADPNTDAVSEVRRRVEAGGGRYYAEYREMFEREADRLDLVVIATPHHYHFQMAAEALEAGFHVLVEKPPTVTVQDLDALIARWRRTDRLCAVGFHQIGAPGLQALKELATSGRMGTVRAVKVHTVWCRPYSYYERAPWAGTLHRNGAWVLDGPTLNPLAHGINNALFAASPERHGYAKPVKVRGELYRAHRIESEDTSCARIDTDVGVPVYYFGTLCGLQSSSPVLRVEGDLCTVCLHGMHELRIRHSDGEQDRFEMEDDGLGGHQRMMNAMIEAVHSGTQPPTICSPVDARAYLLAANGIFESSAGIATIPPPHSRECDCEQGPTATIDGIDQIIPRASTDGTLFSEMDLPWGRATKAVDVSNYTHFTGDAYRAK